MTTRLLREELRRASLHRPSAFTIGTFDGVHRGHRFLVETLKQRATARSLATGVITLHPHPLTVLRPGTHVTYLTDLDERMALLAALGAEAVVPVTFTSEVSQVSAEEFVDQMVEELQLRFLLIGPDSALGRGREGAGERLVEIGAKRGVEVEFAGTEAEGGQKIGSTEIRDALTAGDLERVSFLLGRRYSLTGPVVHGAERGRTLGFPTANIAIAADRATPGLGVYAARTCVDGTEYAAAVNIGNRPTFVDNGQPTVEAYLLDFDGDLYGRELRVDFVRRLRGEMKFDGVEAFKAQLQRDVEAARISGRADG